MTSKAIEERRWYSRIVKSFRWFLDPNPIVMAELHAMVRSLGFRSTYIVTIILASVVVGVVLLNVDDRDSSFAVGIVAYSYIYVLAFFLVTLVAPVLAVLSTSAERRQGSYESLMVTGFRPARLIFGKHLGVTLFVGLILVAIWPLTLLCIPYMSVSIGDIVLGFAALLSLLVVTVSLGVAIGSWVSSARVAVILTSLAMLTQMAILLSGREFGLGSYWPFDELQMARLGLLALPRAAAEIPFSQDLWWLDMLMPSILLGLPTSLYLLLAIRGAQPKKSERSSTGLKLWSIALVIGSVLIFRFLKVAPLNVSDSFIQWYFSDIGKYFVGLVSASILLILLQVMLLSGEPMSPAYRASRVGVVRRLLAPLSFFGHGVAPTLRMLMLLVVGTAIALPLGASAGLHRAFDSVAGITASHIDRFDHAFLTLAWGNIGIALFLAAGPFALRLVLQKPWNALVLFVACFGLLMTLSLGLTTTLFPGLLFHLGPEFPWTIRLSPLFPAHLACSSAFQDVRYPLTELIPTTASYGALGIVFWMLVEMTCSHRRRAKEKERGERRP